MSAHSLSELIKCIYIIIFACCCHIIYVLYMLRYHAVDIIPHLIGFNAILTLAFISISWQLRKLRKQMSDQIIKW